MIYLKKWSRSDKISTHIITLRINSRPKELHLYYSLKERGDGCFITMGKVNQEIHFINVSLDVSNLQYDETITNYSGWVTHIFIGIYIHE